jgi:hypothetical protein
MKSAWRCWLLFVFVNLVYGHLVGFLGGRIGPSQDLCLHRTKNTHTHTHKTPFIHHSVPCMVFEPTFPVFEWWKAAYVLYPVATVIGTLMRCTSHFRRGRKIANVCPSVRMEQHCYHRTEFYEIWYLGIFRKAIERSCITIRQEWLILCWNAIIHLWQCFAEFFLQWHVSDKNYRENQNKFYIEHLFPNIVPFMK